ncbi:DUF3558 domain-containing protein [Lentzea sp. NPDC004789]
MKRTLIAAAIGLVALTVGCTGTKGDAKPDPTGGTPTSSSEAQSGLASIKPCDLLTEADAKSVGLSYPGETADIGTAKGCDWRASGNGGLSASVRAKSGVKELNFKGDKISEIKVGKFTATKVEAPDGDKAACSVLIAVTESSSVSVQSNMDLSSTDTATACDRASKAAEKIAAKLP